MFVVKTSISMSILMNIRMNGESSMKYHFLKKKKFIATWYGGNYRCRLHACKKSFERLWNKEFGSISWFVT